MDKPRLVWHSNSPLASTGYGMQTALFAPRLRDDYDVVISAFYGLEGNVIHYQDVPVLPGIAGTYDESITAHIDALWRDRRAGTVMTLMDVWVLDPNIWARFNTASWVPVDHEPAPEPVRRFFLESGAIPVAMSKFGENQLRDLDPLYCPHAVDTSIYRPVDRAEAREALGLKDDAFIVGMVAANKGNPSRKCFSEAFQAFKLLRERHANAVLYLHTEISGRFQGVNLRELLRSVDIPLDSVVFCDQYRAMHLPFAHRQMAQVYSSLDVLLSPSAGEGFGIPVIEAQACGTPVIVSDFSAQPELCKAGWTVKGTKHYTPIGAWQFRPDVQDIYEKLRTCYTLSDNARQELGDKAREAMAAYDVEHVLAEHMLPTLEEIRERYEARQPVELAA